MSLITPLSMTIQDQFKLSPWDSAVLGTDAYEITTPNIETFERAQATPGHYTVRIDPLESKQNLQKYGFYYCDTLIEPYCTVENWKQFTHFSVSISEKILIASLLEVCDGAFSHDRFHRDFNATKEASDQRYNNWLSQLHASGKVHGLFYKNETAGFIAAESNSLVLHAIAPAFRGQGLAKYLWSPVCSMLFERGHKEITSSISTTNLAVLNLYARLGFRFRNPVDIYHRWTR